MLALVGSSTGDYVVSATGSHYGLVMVRAVCGASGVMLRSSTSCAVAPVATRGSARGAQTRGLLVLGLSCLLGFGGFWLLFLWRAGL